MSCYKPNFVYYNDGKVGRFGGRLTDAKLKSIIPGQEIVQVPCGKCIGCRLDRSKNWADRMLLEFCTHRDGIPDKSALFLTLTYDDNHVPIIFDNDVPLRSLKRKDMQDFLKRLRGFYKKQFDRRIRIFYAGEYGDVTFRPHYHMILFGASLSDFSDHKFYSYSSGFNLYDSKILNDIWENGLVRFSVASYQTFCYVGRYILKKQFFSPEPDGFINTYTYYRGRVPPFIGMSLKPALGSDYFDTIDSNKVRLFDGNETHDVSIPRVTFEKLKLTNPELYAMLKEQRRYIASKHTDLIKEQIDCNYFDYLENEEHLFSERKNCLKRRNKI